MFTASSNTIKTIAAVIWITGAITLGIKSSSLLIQATEISPELPWVWIAVLTGLVIGAIKTKYLFTRLCYKNLNRIDELKQPKLWQCYRPQFFIFLFLMISLGAYMSRIAEGNYFMLIDVAIVDLSIATALFGSSLCFWRKQ
ncbi:MAG: hypothetical protein HOM14_09315 [Gammaproteobacteria bacterium]|jgi:hypothetical protein|nr:hypothetical protein [Gammaproteobacteria bacterium]MBT3724446.1 hypothetical protein [Gammaproteobacteria bacterium]MBT4076407.1 hypothetical protein [Gammaproteobacteria bacterium]MBT4195616.1 hypothetical protein [Gammaproteobacteria bacterium]MBT4450551.1 hypothetical protein [Gammaproteobacteria bacterium]